ncbi:MAG: DUF1501 domain-containing protein [Pirellulales bacterium]
MSFGQQDCRGPVTRRTALKLGSLAIGSWGVGGFGLGDLGRMQARAAWQSGATGGGRKEDNSVIFVWLPGGPPHMEMYDLKPNAPLEYRGEFQPIATSVPGLDVGELLPLHAKLAQKYNVIRSVHHQFADHGGGHKRFMTGRDPKEPTGFVNDYPAVPSLVAQTIRERRRGVPNYVCGTDRGRQGIDTFSFGSAYLGNSSHPFMVPGDPSAADFKIDNLSPSDALADRLDDRVALLDKFDNWRRKLDRAGAKLESPRRIQSPSLGARDERKSSQGVRYLGGTGRRARALRQACVRSASVNGSPPCGSRRDLRDDGHGEPATPRRLAEVRELQLGFARRELPLVQRRRSAVPALRSSRDGAIEDLYARGLDKRVLLVVTGEFGRTPRVSYSVGTASGVTQPGRDHWPNAMSMIVAGGGMRTGQVIGATNSKGEYPTERPLTPNDLWATVLAHLGIDSELAYPDHNGRPMPLLPFGEPIKELLPTA